MKLLHRLFEHAATTLSHPRHERQLSRFNVATLDDCTIVSLVEDTPW